MASLPRFDPFQVLRYPPQRDEIPATPPHTLKRNALGRAFRFHTARKSVTVARLWPEKKGRGKRALCGGLFRLFDVYLLHGKYRKAENKCVKYLHLYQICIIIESVRSSNSGR
jgi:hypothetical protein